MVCWKFLWSKKYDFERKVERFFANKLYWKFSRKWLNGNSETLFEINGILAKSRDGSTKYLNS